MSFSASFVSLTVLTTLLSITSVNASPIPASPPQDYDATDVIVANNDNAIKKPCLTACPMIYMPVCGKNKSGERKTFGNSDILGAYNCEHPKDNYTAISQNAYDEKPGCPYAANP